MSPRIRLVFLAIFLVLVSAEHLLAGQARGTTRNAPAPAPPPVMPLSVSQVIESLYSLGVTKTEDLIAKNKVRFTATPEIIEILKELGATDKLLSAIPQPEPQPVAAPVVEEPKVSGPFHVVCEPSDCNIAVNQRYYGPTEMHNKTLTDLPPGTSTVQVFSNGYDPQMQQVVLQEGKPAEARFRLTLNSDYRHAKGQQMSLDAFQALGGIQMASLMQEFQGDGTLEWKDEKGTTQQGSMKFSRNLNQDLQLDFKLKDGDCSASIAGKTSKQTCKGSLKNAEGIASDAVAFLRQYEIENVMGDILSGTETVQTNDTAPRTETFVGGESYVLKLNNDKLPAELVHMRRGKVDSIITVTYSNYVAISGGKYPSQIEISRDGNPVFAFIMKGISTRAIRSSR